MGLDLHVIWEVKKDNKWIPIGEETPYGGFNRKDSSLENNFIPLLLNRKQLCGWYRTEEITSIHNDFIKRYPLDISNISNELNTEDYFTKEELERFNWEGVIIPFRVSLTKEDYILYKNGAKPETLQYATYIPNGIEIEFDLLFKDHCKDILKELEEMKKYEDYRLLIYYE